MFVTNVARRELLSVLSFSYSVTIISGITGFPYYTHKQDLERIFSHFGVMRLEYIHKKSAVISFKNKEDAQKVLAAKNVNIYASFLEMVVFNPDLHVNGPSKRNIQINPVAFPKSKAKGWCFH